MAFGENMVFGEKWFLVKTWVLMENMVFGETWVLKKCWMPLIFLFSNFDGQTGNKPVVEAILRDGLMIKEFGVGENTYQKYTLEL